MLNMTAGTGLDRRLPIAAVLMVAIVAGCKDSTTAPAVPLTEAEAESLFLGISALVSDTTLVVVSATDTDAVLECPAGGQVTAALQLPEELPPVGDTARSRTGFTITPAGCVVGEAPLRFTLDGNPNLNIQITFLAVETTGAVFFDVRSTGALDWRTGDRSGTCEIDLAGRVELDFGEFDAKPVTVSGTLCGHEVELQDGGIGDFLG